VRWPTWVSRGVAGAHGLDLEDPPSVRLELQVDDPIALGLGLGLEAWPGLTALISRTPPAFVLSSRSTTPSPSIVMEAELVTPVAIAFAFFALTLPELSTP
jgi:hypothetical protein